ncbi:hypothetical protein CWI37_2159p0010 [Hamiltosporidium tvaerminnensis]|uniref:Uncharacterized protein n=1 Tax=Hamiltosporidium tvaerminnensis TaxID=1176355 RepID=A0A4Q9KTT0_9MICR|nr:hypothetical protein CWI37_2159p0010 [Hamiltosporidium tvaerminnensis]
MGAVLEGVNRQNCKYKGVSIRILNTMVLYSKYKGVSIRILNKRDCKYKGVSIRIVIKGVINMCVNKRVLFIWYLDKRVLLKKDIYKGVNME